MSDLSKSVGKAHRKALRDYPEFPKENPSMTENIETPKPKAKTTKNKPVAKSEATAGEHPTQGLKQTDIVAFNQSAEKVAVQYLSTRIQEKGPVTFNTACNLIALELDISVETAKRYLRKYSVDHPKAPFTLDDGYVALREK